MGEVIWVEVLSRHRDVVARHRCEGPQVRIGRGYGNDVIVDDPFVAMHHVRIARDEDGALVAVDLGSANGLFADHGSEKLDRVTLDGDRPIRIGRTYLRIRETSHAIAPERPLAPQGHTWRSLLALGGAVLGLEGTLLWLGETGESQLSRYVLPLLALSLITLGWTTAWAILSRIFAGQAHFERNLLIALTGLFGYSLYNEFVEYAAFALSWRALANYEYIGAWMFFGAVCFLHLSEISSSRLKLKGGAVAALAVIAISTQTLAQSETRSGYEQNYVRRLKPPALRLRPPESESAFFADVAQLKPRLDQARTEDPTSPGGSSIFDSDD